MDNAGKNAEEPRGNPVREAWTPPRPPGPAKGAISGLLRRALPREARLWSTGGVRLSAAALALGSLAAGCAGLRDLASHAFERPRLSFQSASVEALDLEGVTVSLHYRVENPNAVGLSLAKVAYRLDVEGRHVVSGDLPGGIRLPARGAAPLVVPVRVRFADVPAFVENLLGKEELAWRVSGSVGVDSPIGLLELPYDHAGRAPVPRPPRVAVESARVAPAGLGRVGLDLRLRVTNQNGFAIPAGTLEYGLEVAGAPLAGGRTQALAPLAPRGSALLEVPLRLDVLGAGSALSRALAGQPLDLVLRGSAGYGSLRIPVELRTRLSR